MLRFCLSHPPATTKTSLTSLDGGFAFILALILTARGQGTGSKGQHDLGLRSPTCPNL